MGVFTPLSVLGQFDRWNSLVSGPTSARPGWDQVIQRSYFFPSATRRARICRLDRSQLETQQTQAGSVQGFILPLIAATWVCSAVGI